MLYLTNLKCNIFFTIYGLTELCKEKPIGSDAIRWLGYWLRNNNPSNPVVDEGFADYYVVEDSDELPEATLVDTVLPAGVVSKPNEKEIVFVLGGPGSGKGTVCARISKEFGYAHISTGDLLRREQKRETPLGKTINAHISKGELVPTKHVLRLLKDAIMSNPSKKFLIDGYPRQIDQAYLFEREVAPCRFVLNLDTSDHIMKRRLRNRAKTEKRSDDNEEVYQKRIDLFHKFSKPLIDFYRKLGIVWNISASESAEQVWTQAHTAFMPRTVFVIGPEGCDKSVHCRKISEKYGFQNISVPELLAAQENTGSKVGQLISARANAGREVEAPVVVEVLQAAMEKSTNDKFLISGWPNSRSDAAMFEKCIGSPQCVLHLSTTVKVCKTRLAQLGRDAKSIEESFATYTASIKPMAEFYSRSGLERVVDANHPSDKVWQDVQLALEPKVYFVLGASSSGKTTLCDRVATEFNLVHLSVDDLLRSEVARGSAEGKQLDQIIRGGQIVPISLTLSIIRKAMSACGGRARGYVIDGFPRALDQAKAFEQRVADVTGVLYIKKDADGSVKKNSSEARKRMLFDKQCLPVINYFSKRGLVTYADSALGNEIVYQRSHSMFINEIVFAIGPPGAGKTTICNKLASTFGYQRLCLQTLLKAECERGTPSGKMVQSMMAKRKIIPSFILLRMLHNAMKASGKRRFLIDGYPRSREQIQRFQETIGLSSHSSCLYFNVEENIAAERLGLSSVAIAQRFNTWNLLTKPVIPELKRRNMLRMVDANGSIDETFSQCEKIFLPNVSLLLSPAGTASDDVVIHLGRRYGYVHLNIPLLLDNEASMGSEDGKVIAKCIRLKRTVPNDVVARVAHVQMRSAGSGKKFLISGYPRTISAGFPMHHDQAFYLEENIGVVEHVIKLTASVNVRNERAGEKVVRQSDDIFQREIAGICKLYADKVVEVDTTDTASIQTNLDEILK